MSSSVKTGTIENHLNELMECIKTFVIDSNIKCELLQFLSLYFHKGKNTLHRSQYYNKIIGWILIIISLEDKKIKDLNWNFLCDIHNKNLIEELITCRRYYENKEISIPIEYALKQFKNRKVALGWIEFYKALNEFYIYLLNSPQYNHFENIVEINKYKHFMIDTYKINASQFYMDKDYQQIVKTIVNNYPSKSRYDQIVQAEYILDGGVIGKSNYNTRTENKFIKNVLLNFILSFNGVKESTSKITKIFIYYFNESLNETVIKKYEDFNEECFYLQYDFFEILDDELREKGIIKEIKELKHILVAFYRYLIEYTERELKITLFSVKFRQVIYSKRFYKLHKSGFDFVYHNKRECPPSSEKFCILPSVQTLHNANKYNNTWMKVDLSNIHEKYREDVKNFVWYTDGYTKNIINYLYKLGAFIEFKIMYDDINSNIISISPKSDKEFSEDFLWEYRSTEELNATSGSHLKNIFKTIRKYLKYYEEKYNVTHNDLDILNLKGLEQFDGGRPITKKDCALIYKEFEKKETQIQNGRLYTIVFEIFLLTNLRIGAILNLKRNCIIYKNDDYGIIEYLSKTSNKEFIEKNIKKEIISLLEEAGELTQPYVLENDIMSEYIFIEPYKARHIYKNKRINFYRYFKNVTESIKDKLEITDYVPYNLRHTYIDNVYREGIKNGLSIPEMAAITGIGYKTANLHYRKYNEIDLYVETMARVTISDVDIYGNILETEDDKYQRNVKKDLGKCDTKHCVFDLGECLSCNHFVTFINRIPAFEQRIAQHNEEIEKSTNILEIEELNAQKKLLGRYLAEMYKIKEAKGINN